MKKTGLLAVCIAIPLLTGGISGWLTAHEIKGWYAALQKPFFNPPNYVFGPVWTALYLAMGVSLYRVVRHTSSYRQKAVTIFGIQLVLNFLWSIIFFKLHMVGLAAADIVLMWLAILAMIITFARMDKPAAWLQVPYLLWVSFATALNFAILHLNAV